MQGMESYCGLMIATTNYGSHIDQAFYRRFNKIVDFQFPDEAGILADHNSIAGIDIFYHADNVDPLAVVSFIVTSKNAFDCHV